MSMDKQALIEALQDMEDFAILKQLQCPPIYLLGGSACIIEGYIDRVTRDIDIVDLEYPAQIGRLFKVLGDVDYIDIGLTTLAHTYQKRAIRIEDIKHIQAYVLSREDIIVTKIGRYSAKDKEDIAHMMGGASKVLINQLIQEVRERTDLSPKIKYYFQENVVTFRRDFDV